MPESRIDNLRALVANIGQHQLADMKFFHPLADRLVQELGVFLGDPACVGLAPNSGDFNFDHGSYGHEGVGFEGRRFRIPLMFRIRNLNDDGDLQIRLRLYFARSGEHQLRAELSGSASVTASAADLTGLLAYIYEHLCRILAAPMWFAEYPADYQQTQIGFTRTV